MISKRAKEYKEIVEKDIDELIKKYKNILGNSSIREPSVASWWKSKTRMHGISILYLETSSIITRMSSEDDVNQCYGEGQFSITLIPS